MIWVSFYSESEEVLDAEADIYASMERTHAFKHMLALLEPNRHIEDVDVAARNMEKAMMGAERGVAFSAFVGEGEDELVKGWVMPVVLDA